MAPIDETKTILGDLIAFPTVSGASNLELIAYAAERLGACGATISMMRDETGHRANLFATLGPQVDGGIVLSGHTDVVPADEQDWESDPFTMREAGGRLYGRGACDMKGFLAAALAVAPRFAERGLHRPIHFALTYDEETGCHGARHLVGELARMDFRPSVAIVGEPTEMRVVEGHKGCFEYTTAFTGLEGHGSRPDAGVNAVEYAVRYAARLMALAEELKSRAPKNRFRIPWTTLQVGRMEGGTARNVVAGHCSVEWEMRPVSKHDADFVRAALKAYCQDALLPEMRAVSPDADIVTEVIGEVDGLAPAAENEARRIACELTGTESAEVVGFGTEADLFQALGMSVVVCGPGSIAQAHKPNEFVAVDQLERCLGMLGGLGRKLAK